MIWGMVGSQSRKKDLNPCMTFEHIPLEKSWPLYRKLMEGETVNENENSDNLTE